MKITNYSTGAHLGTSSINEDEYEAYVAADTTGTGAVKAGDWISDGDLSGLGIAAELTVFFD